MKISFLSAHIYKNKTGNKTDAEHFLIVARSNIQPWIHELIKKNSLIHLIFIFNIFQNL